jgi:predicted MFS family arabinose efflux permease
MKHNVNLLAAAFALTAVSYGLARFAFGLLLPEIRTELSLDIATTGWIGSSAFVAYCIGVCITFALNRACSPRALAFAAGLASTIGMVIITLSTSGIVLGLGVALAGLSTGLTSPPLATAVSLQFDDAHRPKANAIINAGTAAGIVLSGLVSLLAFGGWRELYILFSVISGAVAVWVLYAVPTRHERTASEPTSFAISFAISFVIFKRPGMLALCTGSFLMGLSSTAIWTFGGSLLRDEFNFTQTDIAWIWVALGLAGVAGAMTGVFVQRFGLARVHWVSLAGMAAGIVGLSFTSVSVAFAFVSVALFGASYITSSGAFLIQGIRLLPDRPDLGLGIPFLILAAGQSAGSPLFGALLSGWDADVALAAFAGVALLSGFIVPRQSAAKAPPAHVGV